MSGERDLKPDNVTAPTDQDRRGEDVDEASLEELDRDGASRFVRGADGKLVEVPVPAGAPLVDTAGHYLPNTAAAEGKERKR